MEANFNNDDLAADVKNALKAYHAGHRLLMNDEAKKALLGMLTEFAQKYAVDVDAKKALDFAYKRTDKDTYQAMEALIHNLCTLNSRAGSQVPFSSLNTGMDTSEEGRMVTKNLFLATEAGLGNGETPIFPISIFSMKKASTERAIPIMIYSVWHAAVPQNVCFRISIISIPVSIVSIMTVSLKPSAP